MCNMHCFSIATVVTRTRVNVASYVYCLPRLSSNPNSCRTRVNVTSYVYCLPRLSSNPNSSRFIQSHKTSQSFSYRYVLKMSVVSKLLGTMAKSRHKMSAGHIVKIAYVFTCLSLMIIHCQ